jgi:hypothetical protein
VQWATGQCGEDEEGRFGHRHESQYSGNHYMRQGSRCGRR